MFRLIKWFTEAEARHQGMENWEVSLPELDAFVGILYVRGAIGGKNLPIDFLWSEKYGNTFIRETMCRRRFKEIHRFIRFDDKTIRRERLQTDKFALVSSIWDRFIDNCLRCYKGGVNLTIDEQLLPSKCRCPITQYMPNKPDKFGIKFWMLVDAESKYICNAKPYLGKEEGRPRNEPLGAHVIMTFMEPYIKKGHNVTCDNFFTSLYLARQLSKFTLWER